MIFCAGCFANDIQQSAPDKQAVVILKAWEFRAGCPSDSSKSLSEILSTGEWKPSTSIGKITDNSTQNAFWFKSTLPCWDGPSPTLYLGQVNFPIQVFLNGALLFENGPIMFQKPVLQGWNQTLLQLPAVRTGDLLVIHVQTENGNTGFDNEVMLTSYQPLLDAIWNRNVKGLVLAIIFLALGIITLSIYFILQRSKLLWGSAVFLLSLSTFILANSTFLHVLYHHPALFYHLDYISFIFANIGGFYAIAQVLAVPYRDIGNWLWKIHVVILFVTIVLLQTTLITYLDLLPYISAVLTCNMVISSVLMARSARKGDVESKILFGGMTGFFIFAVGEIILFYIYGIHSTFGYNVRILDYGALIFTISLIWAAIYRYISTERQKTLARLNELEAVKNASKAQQEFTNKLIESQENERHRIAQELHDSVGQKLLLIKNQLAASFRLQPASVLNMHLERIDTMTKETIHEIRSIAYNLQPQYLEQLGLTTTIQSLVESIQEASTIRFHLKSDMIDKLIPPEYEINFFRIVQEGLNNVIKHSGATEATIIIQRTVDAINLEIRDNGSGFQPHSPDNISGMGLPGMQERARILGAALTISPIEPNGTSVHMEYPLHQEHV